MLFLLFVLMSSTIISQNYQRVDSIVMTYPKNINSTNKLAKKISGDFSDDYEKVRAVYSWIVNNIVYEPTEYGKFKFKYTSQEEFEIKQKTYRGRLAFRVLSKRKAVCEGYSVLFHVLCNELGIKAIYVSGSSKTRINDIGKRFSSDHSWNIVEIGENRYLIDATWGAGTYNTHFVKNVNYSYFFTDPENFIYNHYPDNYEYALLDEVITKEEFLENPVVYDFEYKIVSPQKGILYKNELDKVVFKFLAKNKVGSISYKIGKDVYLVDEVFDEDDAISFRTSTESSSSKGRELVIYFDNKAVAGFRLK